MLTSNALGALFGRLAVALALCSSHLLILRLQWSDSWAPLVFFLRETLL